MGETRVDLQRLLAVGAKDEHAFITQFLAHWGGSESKKTRRRRNRG